MSLVALSRQEHSRSVEPDGEGGAEILCRGAEDHRETAVAGGSRVGILAAGAVGDDALRRRSAAHETGGASAAGLTGSQPRRIGGRGAAQASAALHFR